MKKFLYKLMVWTSLIAGLIWMYGLFCDFYFSTDQYLDKTNKKQWILSLEGQKYDYAILGSSRAFGAFDMVMLDSLTGLNGINIGANGSAYKDNYLMLHRFLMRNKIKKVLLQVDLSSLNSKQSFSNEFHAFSFLPYWNDPYVREVLKEEVPVFDNGVTDYFPYWRYFYFNKYFSPKEVVRRFFLRTNNGQSFRLGKGGMNSTPVQPANIAEKIEPKRRYDSVDSHDYQYLLKIIELAEAKGVEVILFTAPLYLGEHSYLSQVVEKLQLSHIAANPLLEINPIYFRDGGHLNEYGRYWYTVYFANEILNKSITTHQ